MLLWGKGGPPSSYGEQLWVEEREVENVRTQGLCHVTQRVIDRRRESRKK